MILETKRLWFKKVMIYFDDGAFRLALKSRKYSQIVGVSYNPMNEPEVQTVARTTALIDLTLPEAEITKRFSPTTRNEINRTYRSPNLNFLSSDDANEAIERKVHDLYREFELVQGRVPASFSEVQLYKAFFAEYQNEIVSAVYVIESWPYLRLHSIFSKRLNVDLEMKKIVSNASRRVFWDACLYGRSRGFRNLDLGSVNFKDPAVASRTQFKMSFGGDVSDEYVHIYHSPFYGFFKSLTGAKLFGKPMKRFIQKFQLRLQNIEPVDFSDTRNKAFGKLPPELGPTKD